MAVYDDGDEGVYKHTDLGDWDNKSILKSKGVGISLEGGTKFWDEFADHDEKGNILSTDGVNYRAKGARIHFGLSKDDDINAVNWNWFWECLSSIIPGSLSTLIARSFTGGIYDIKVNNTLGLNLSARDGYLFNGKYVTGESLGNYLFGMNLETLRTTTVSDDILGLSKSQVFNVAAGFIGDVHNRHANNPQIAPYYGEIPYSGRQIVLGYWNNNADNPVFKQYTNAAIYGPKKTVK